MKRSSLVSLLIILTLVLTLLCSVTITASAVSGGTITKDGSTIYASDDYYYHVNEQFEYTPADDAESYFYVEFDSVEDFENLDSDELYALTGKVVDAVPTVDEDADALVYYVFADVYEDGTVSDTRVVCYDVIAPIINSEALMTWLTTSEDAVMTNDSDDTLSFSLSASWIPAGDDFIMPTSWAELFTIITESTATVVDDDTTSINTDMLTIYLEYCAPSDYYDEEEWSSVDYDDTFDIDELGEWKFRYVVEDMAGNTVTSEVFTRTARSVISPTITLSSTATDYNTDGIVAGTTYSIPTPTCTDSLGSSLTATYVVYKLVGGEYVAIYDSETDEVLEGYEDYVSTGYITPASDEVSEVVDGDYVYIYKIEYYVVDSNGLSATETLEIRTNQSTDLTGLSALTTWEWVLISISVLSAIAIVCLLVIKPKAKAFDPESDKQ